MTNTYYYLNDKLLSQFKMKGSTATKWFFVYLIPCRIGIWKCWFLRRGENQSTRWKTSVSKGENQQQTQTKYARCRDLNQATLVGGEHSQHCTIRSPLFKLFQPCLSLSIFYLLVLILISKTQNNTGNPWLYLIWIWTFSSCFVSGTANRESN